MLARLSRDINLRLLYPRMSSGHVQGRLLRMLTAMIAPRRVLEIGTYAAYSTLCIAEGLPEGATLDTVEIDEEMEDFIRLQLSRSPFGSRVTLHIGDAARVVPGLEAPFDMAYIDADKRTYLPTYRMVLPHCRQHPLGWQGASSRPQPRPSDRRHNGVQRLRCRRPARGTGDAPPSRRPHLN